MKQSPSERAPQYIIDESGKKTGVILDIKTYEKLVEDIEDVYLAALAQARLEQEQERVGHDDVNFKAHKERRSSQLPNN